MWAVNDQLPSVTWAVIGWIERTPNTALPVVVPVAGGMPVSWSGADGEAMRWTFTTNAPATDLISAGEAKLRARMAALADDLARAYPNYGAASHAVTRIRQELAK